MVKKPVIALLEHEGFCNAALASLREHYDVVMFDVAQVERLVPRPDVVGLLVRLRWRIDDNLISAFPNLRFVASPTTGLSHLDLAGLARRNIEVLTLKGETALLDTITSTAELTWALLLSLTRQLPLALASVTAGGWDRDKFRGIDLSGRVLGIVGYGRLGRIIEDYARAFRMSAVIYDVKACSPAFGRLVSFHQLLAESDIVTLHVDLNQTSEGMFGAAEFARMKKNSLFLNTSRGELVDEDALITALQSRTIAGAAVDVIRNEQTVRADSPLLAYAKQSAGRLLITPHLGGASHDAMAKTESFIVEKILARQYHAPIR